MRSHRAPLWAQEELKGAVAACPERHDGVSLRKQEAKGPRWALQRQ